MTYAPSEDSDQPGHPRSLTRVFVVCSKDDQGPMGTAKTLIRLGRSESSLGAQIIVLVLSCRGSFTSGRNNRMTCCKRRYSAILDYVIVIEF